MKAIALSRTHYVALLASFLAIALIAVSAGVEIVSAGVERVSAGVERVSAGVERVSAGVEREVPVSAAVVWEGLFSPFFHATHGCGHVNHVHIMWACPFNS